MDWNKTKSILIITFLCINILLGYKLWFDSGTEAFSPWIVPEREKEVLAHLEEKNITYEGEIPTDIKSKSFYEIESISFDENRFFNSININRNEFKKIENENFTLYLGPRGKMVCVYKSGMVKFYFPGGYIPEKSLIQDSIWRPLNSIYWGKEFINSIYTPGTIFLDRIYINDNNEIELIYHQKMQDKSFYGGYLRILLSPGGIKKGQFFWLDFKGKSENTIEIIPASTALLRLTNHMVISERSVLNELSLGYYTQEFFAESWEAVPVWKARFEDGRSYYINAFTGELEGKLEAFEY